MEASVPRRIVSADALQPPLPGFRLGAGRLFAEATLNRYLSEHIATPLPISDGGIGAIRTWLSDISLSPAGELTLDPEFLEHIFCGVLGYTKEPSPQASLWAKPPKSLTRSGGTPDAVLGASREPPRVFSAVVELKSPGTPLDRPQASYGNRTPVDQAFDYAREIFQVRWVVVSDMVLLRLYAVESQDDYEEVDLRSCVGRGAEITDALRRLHFLFGRGYLVDGHEESQVSSLYHKSTIHRIEVRDGFYEAYREIRADLYAAIRSACSLRGEEADAVELLRTTQRLLDRMMFIYYCEDHPQGLLPNGLIERVTNAASTLPGSNPNRVYGSLKALFREIDAGNSPYSGVKIAAYNGELFKDDPILDHVDLPDTLHKSVYFGRGADRQTRPIDGAWGLHVYDFWTELNEHLLGHIFEESLSEIDAFIASGRDIDLQRLEERRRHGVFYTTDILSDFLARGILRATLDEATPESDRRGTDAAKLLRDRIAHLLELKVVDFACGSGAFLVSVYREMARELWRLNLAVAELSSEREDLFSTTRIAEQADIVRSCIYGVDLLPQAVEIAKLALWLSSVQKDKRVADLSSQLIAADSLDVPTLHQRLNMEVGSFDIVLGNPPWGVDVNSEVYEECIESLDLLRDCSWDSWELFLALSLKALRPGGRMALLLPDTFFYPEKAKTRQMLFESAEVEKVQYLGPDWFGSGVRMGTVAVQARRGPHRPEGSMQCFVLAGDLRREAIRGNIQLSQVESLRGRRVPIQRTLDSPSFEVEVFRGIRDDRIIETMIGNGIGLSDLCERGRGEEMSRDGLAWRCPGCERLTAPGQKRRGGGCDAKECPRCGLQLTSGNALASVAVLPGQPTRGTVGFIDGLDIAVRYRKLVPTKQVHIDRLLDPKPEALYAPPKILIREAGVGISAALDETTSRCPRSVYLYRLSQECQSEGYSHEFVLAALLSRTMNYFVLKRFGEIDPAKAFAKLRHEHLAELPIPRVDFSLDAEVRAHQTIVQCVRRLLDEEARTGGEDDQEIEWLLRQLWGLSAEDGAYINGEFHGLPEGQLLRSLFPEGAPLPVGESADV